MVPTINLLISKNSLSVIELMRDVITTFVHMCELQRLIPDTYASVPLMMKGG